MKSHWNGYGKSHWHFGGKWMPWLGLLFFFWLIPGGGFRFIFALIPLLIVGAFFTAGYRYMQRRNWDWDRMGGEMNAWGDKFGTKMERWAEDQKRKHADYADADDVVTDEKPKRKNDDRTFYV
jgi:hypothetical protein